MTERIEELLERIDERIDELRSDVRKQGRASIAAQSAAESCLESVQALRSLPKDPIEEVVRVLAPLLDALERTVDQAQGFADGSVKPSALARWFGASDNTMALTSTAKGTRLLRSQLEDALATWGISVDRRVGVTVDPTRHRVVETRRAMQDEEPEQVAEVVRPALIAGDHVLREADVVATR